MSRVWLACPQRHAILAASGEALDQIEAPRSASAGRPFSVEVAADAR